MMTDAESHYERAKELFCAALELETSARPEFVRAKCSNDAILQKEVLRLLSLDDAVADAGSDPLIPATIDQVALRAALQDFQAAVSTAPDIPAGKLPTRIGRYTIEGILGQGGMGLVYRARQAEPDRVVALKVIRTGLPTATLVRRFRQEAAALGRLRHPGIAQIYEAGTAETPLGPQPFFALELVEGVPLLHYAEETGLTERPRLELFCAVCAAVQHAHQKGVIHRDLKPANILVDEQGQPKILDFGVARLVDPERSATTMHTEVGQLVGTFQYMSPEQAQGDPAAVDTRSDVYALGMVLYELLTGRMPYDLSACSIPEAVRMITETTAEPISLVSRNYRGDLVMILRKVLAKDRDERYQTADALAEDLRRYLRNEPILAQPASTWYQLRKFTARNKGLVVGGVSALAFLLLVSVVMTVLALYALQQTKLAENETEKAGGLVASILSVIDSIDPENAQGQKKTTDDLLGELIQQVNEELAEYPVSAASIRHRVGITYRQLGMYAEAEEHLLAAFEARRQHLGMADAQTRESEYELGHVLFRLNRLEEARGYLQSAFAYRMTPGESVAVGEADGRGKDEARTFEIMNDLGALALVELNLAQAEELLLPAQASLQAAFGADAPLTLTVSNNLGHLRYLQKRFVEAEVLLREVLDRRRRTLGSEHIDTLDSMDNLAQNCVQLKQYEEARQLREAALAVRRRVVGNEHPLTLLAMANLIQTLRRMLEFDAAETLTEEFLGGRAAFFARAPERAIVEYNNIAAVFRAERKFPQALEILQDVYAVAQAELGAEAEKTLAAGVNLAVVLIQLEAYPEAEEFLGAAITRTAGEDVTSRFYRAVYNIYLGRCLLERDAFAIAEPALKAGYEGMVEWEDANHPQAVIARSLLERLYRETGQEEKIAEYFSN